MAVVPLFMIWMLDQIHCVAVGSPFIFTVNIVFAVHVVPMQTYGGPAQSLVAAHVVLHAPVPHA